MPNQSSNQSNYPKCSPPQEKVLFGVYDKDSEYVITETETNCTLSPIAPDGYKLHSNPETSEILPKCCDFHNTLFMEAKQWFEVFPNCCENHKDLAKKSWFNKKDFAILPEKIVRQVSLTEYFLSNNINNHDWFKAISSYIDHNFLCFGIYGTGLSLYLTGMVRSIKASTDLIPASKSSRLISHINYLQKHYKYDFAVIDWTIQSPTYKIWLETFPFDLGPFKKTNIKERFRRVVSPTPYDTKKKKFVPGPLSILNEMVILETVNKYTDELLGQISTYLLFEKGKLKEPDRIELELIIQKRKLKNQLGYNRAPGREPVKYQIIIEEWLADEISFLREVRPFLKYMPKDFEAELAELRKESDIVFLSQEEVPESLKEIAEGGTVFKLIPKESSQAIDNHDEVSSQNLNDDEGENDLEQRNRTKIKEVFEETDENGWQFAFRSEDDYKTFENLLVKKFMGEPFELPKKTIDLKYKTKTMMSTVLGQIHQKLGERLSTDQDFFNIVRIIKQFKAESDPKLYKALTRYRGASR